MEGWYNVNASLNFYRLHGYKLWIMILRNNDIELSSLFAVINTVSPVREPLTSVSSKRTPFAAGSMKPISSSTKRPPLPAWGFNPVKATWVFWCPNTMMPIFASLIAYNRFS
ncbi:hypothetical protein BBC0122_020590 [Bartonella choladocola]|uniref:Uncharacterized protein n=1 Tax=Bartonella choladocola TaxID=2750995 RepID=A0A1U9MKH5_9HYPH|nr:hypothetical protein BBC0122_020590 [Bartonella choladocola]